MSDPSRPPADFAGLYRATVVPLRRHLARLLGNESEAQDVAHDAYLRVYPSITADTARKPEALLYTTARRLAFNQLKRRRIGPIDHHPGIAESAMASAPGVVQQVIARQEFQRVQDAIAQLPPGCREVLLLRKVNLLSHKEIAARLGIAISTVEKQHARALRLLRTLLSEPAGEADATGGSAQEAGT